MDNISSLLSSQAALALLFGFLVYAYLTTWRRMSARLVNWLPPLAKLIRFLMYVLLLPMAVFLMTILAEADKNPNTWPLVIAGLVAGPVLNRVARFFRPKDKIRRGARIGLPAAVNKQTKKLPATDFAESFSIGGVKIPRSAEPYHFFVVGSTGSGKSVAITDIIDHLEARGDLALVVDSGGEYAARYYREGRDHILNPFDDRCVPWSPTTEMAGPWDAEALAKSMVPDGVGDMKEWNGYAQTLVTSVLRRLEEQNKLSIKDLLYFVQAAPIEELTPFLAGTAAAAQLTSEKTFGSIRTIASNYLATYAYLSDHDDPFSISKFIRKEKGGFLFLTYRDDQLDSLRNMISCALDVAARTILALPANSNRRIWLIIDEFASIGRVQSIEAVATKARKMGGCLLIGLQSVSQLQDRYGEKAAQTILSCLSSWLVLRCSDAETSEYVSKYIGETEISRMTRSESTSESGGGSDSRNEQIQTQRAVLPVELQRLANLRGFFKLSGDYSICNIKLSFPKKRASNVVNYAERDFHAKPMLSLVPAQPSEEPQPSVDEAAVRNNQAWAPGSQEGIASPPRIASQEEVTPAVMRPRANPLDAGPALLEEVLNEMAELSENLE